MNQLDQKINPDDSPIYQYLFRFCRGKNKAIKADDLARQFNISRRDINDEIRTLRRSGALIGSSREKPYGYFVPNCREEAKEFMSAYREEVMDMLVTFNRMKWAQRHYLDGKKQDSFDFSPADGSHRDDQTKMITRQEQLAFV
ncbi:MAG: HTH domain-containing protein [Candidatus Omnitrophota bacterium]